MMGSFLWCALFIGLTCASTPHHVTVTVGVDDTLPVLSTSEAAVLVEFHRARTILDIVTVNTANRNRLEGTVCVTLPPGAKPFLMAFGASHNVTVTTPMLGTFDTPEHIMGSRAGVWLDGTTPKEAVMVKQSVAARAYGDQVRRNVDPALLEESSDNVYSVRIFPLDAGVIYRVVLAYDVELPAGGNIRTATFHPVTGENSVSGMLHVLSMHLPNPYEAHENAPVTVRVGQGADDGLTSAILVGTDGAHFIGHATVPVMGDTSSSTSSEVHTPGRHVLFLIDASLSSRRAMFQASMDATVNMLTSLREGSNVSFNVVLYNIRSWWWKPRGTWLDNTEDNIAELRDMARAVSPYGASDLVSALQDALMTNESVPLYDVVLLSDGVTNWGPHEDVNTYSLFLRHNRAAISGRCVHAFVADTFLKSADSVNTENLRKLALGTGGTVLESPDEIKAALFPERSLYRVEAVAAVNGEGNVISGDVFLDGDVSEVHIGQGVSFVGRVADALHVKGIDLVVSSQNGKETIHITFAETFRDGVLPLRAFGIVAVSKLHEVLPESESVAQTYAVGYRVVGKTASLLMLELQDYATYGIDPKVDGPRALSVASAMSLGEYLASTVKRKCATLSPSGAVPLRSTIRADIDRIVRNAGVRMKPLPAELWTMLDLLPSAAFAVYDESIIGGYAELWPQLSAPLAGEIVQTQRASYDSVLREAEGHLPLNPLHALLVYSSLVDQAPSTGGDDIDTLRDVMMTAAAWKLPRDAFDLARRVVLKRPFQPVGILNMGKQAVGMGMPEVGGFYYEGVLAGKWPDRYRDIVPYTAFLYGDGLRRATHLPKGYAESRMRSMHARVPPADLLVTLTWSSDNSDLDLHVKEPSGEVCSYKKRRTKSGGSITQDVTQGFGPEMYHIPKGADGAYQISVNYFAQQRSATTARSRVIVDVVKGWGCPWEEHSTIVKTLSSDAQTLDVAAVILETGHTECGAIDTHSDTQEEEEEMSVFLPNLVMGDANDGSQPVLIRTDDQIVPGYYSDHAAYASMSIQSANAEGSRAHRKSHLLLIDVIPLSVRIESANGTMIPIVHRNSPIPTRKSVTITTVHDNQDIITVKLYEGERSTAAGNMKFFEFNITGVTLGPKGSAQYVITFEVDENSMYHVTVLEVRTQRVIFKEEVPSTQQSGKEIGEHLRQAEASTFESVIVPDTLSSFGCNVV